MTRNECEKWVQQSFSSFFCTNLYDNFSNFLRGSVKTWQNMKKSNLKTLWIFHSFITSLHNINNSIKIDFIFFKGSKKNQEMLVFSSDKSASKYWPRVIYSIALIRLSAWIILITFCLVCFESSAVELNKLIRESRPHFSGLTVEQTRDFLIIYLIFGVLYVLIDRKYPFFIICFSNQLRRKWLWRSLELGIGFYHS